MTTTDELATLITPYVRTRLVESRGEVMSRAGVAGRAALALAWPIIINYLLKSFVKAYIEISIAASASTARPFVPAFRGLLPAIHLGETAERIASGVADLLQQSSGELPPPTF